MRTMSCAVVLAIAVASLGLGPVHAQPHAVQAVLPAIDVAALPPEARETLRLIRSGGPFPFERDGVRFGNRERLLPPKPRTYYHEYTVRTPAARNRGARRIVCGGEARAPDVCYYTDDHYRSFARVRE